MRQELVDKYIVVDLEHGVGGARLDEYGVSVWALVSYYEAVGNDPDRVARDYDLPREAVEAALEFYREHKALIDARIAEHRAAFV